MRKAIIDSATDEVIGVAVVAEPQGWQANVIKRITRPFRPEARWTDPKTGRVIIKEAIPEESRYVLNADGHGLRPTSGPFVPSGDLPPELTETAYFVKVIDENDFLLMDSVDGLPIEITPNKDGIAVMLTEVGYDPGTGRELVDDDGAAQRGGKWNRTQGKFETPPPAPDIPDPAKERRAAIEAATTVAQLRAAILLPE